MELNFLNDSQIEELQMIAEIINEMVVADGFSDLDSCLKNIPIILKSITDTHVQPYALCAVFKDCRQKRS